MEASAAGFAASLDGSPSAEQVAAMKQQLEGRFRFLWGIYRAHSEVRQHPTRAASSQRPALEARAHPKGSAPTRP